MKIYTKTGDRGTTGLFGGDRVSKTHGRVRAYGEVDELNAVLGVARAALPSAATDTGELLQSIQSDLFDVGAELATTAARAAKGDLPLLTDAAVERLEQEIDAHEAPLEPLTSFVLPGGAPAAAHLHVARTVCRRAERAVTALGEAEAVRGEVLRYLNRLSDLLFVLARGANHEAGVADVPWIGRDRRR
ncbi:MAG: cob(I)yrinic acid a,c-diamide adenosyltransferase [Myxococcota bacterium]